MFQRELGRRLWGVSAWITSRNHRCLWKQTIGGFWLLEASTGRAPSSNPRFEKPLKGRERTTQRDAEAWVDGGIAGFEGWRINMPLAME